MPQSRNEEYLENWRDGQTPTTAPQSRVEARLAHIAGYDVELEEPQSRVEELLAEVEAGLVPEPSGTVNITSNGTHGVAGYAEADVNVQPTLESLTVTQNGTYTPAASDGFDEVTVNVSGGGSAVDPDLPIRFIDYDGTMVATYSTPPAQLPEVPDRTADGLTNGQWNHTLQDVVDQYNACGYAEVGANYDTISGGTEIDVELDQYTLEPYLYYGVNGTLNIGWGDGTNEDVVGTNVNTAQHIQHVYAQAGNYTITMTPVGEASYQIRGESNTAAFTGSFAAACVKKARIGVGCTALSAGAFYYCSKLESVSLPATGTTNCSQNAFCLCINIRHITMNTKSWSNSTFANCFALESLSLPRKDYGIFDYNGISNCHSLKRLVMPPKCNLQASAFANSGIKEVSIPEPASLSNSTFTNCIRLLEVDLNRLGIVNPPSYCFSQCGSLRRVQLNSACRLIYNSAFGACKSLIGITIPATVSVINDAAFSGCLSLREIRFEGTTPPTVTNANAFNNLPTDCKIYVPQGTLAAYTSASNYPDPNTYTYVEE